MVVGITGGIGSGKSSFSKRLMEAGYPVYNTDIEARRLQNTDKEVQKRIIALLGENAYNGDVLNRQFVASVVFDNAGLLKKLMHYTAIGWKKEGKLQKHTSNYSDHLAH